MDKIINIKDRIENQEQKRQVKQYRAKLEAIQRITRCASCHLRCAMCGKYLTSTEEEGIHDTVSYGFTFCGDCSGEFKEFLSSSKGDHYKQVFWHNQEWRDMWAAWFRYQQAIAKFVNSQEFQLLMEEFGVHT